MSNLQYVPKMQTREKFLWRRCTREKRVASYRKIRVCLPFQHIENCSTSRSGLIMPTPSKPHELIRKKLAKRTKEQIALTSGVTPKSLLKSPSQRKSERAKQKALKRAGVKPEMDARPTGNDCRNCPKEPCGRNVMTCAERGMLMPCPECGQRTYFRIVVGEKWECCQKCREKANDQET